MRLEDGMKSEELKLRTKRFAIEICKLAECLPKTKIAEIIGNQLIRSGTSIGANYRSACRARSHSEFIAKMGVVVEEADETIYWLELLSELHLAPHSNIEGMLNEANELTAIFSSSHKTAKNNKLKQSPNSPIKKSRNQKITKSPNLAITKSQNHQIILR